ncbi:MAG: hypothetical protein KatS3mg060_2526 [Dehalococcoidia bacterium]|jgi:hypothetical protein|nr:MAG: hypothetical protein KatS3mg060_2526 [Dehalococcoidia bacterium]
MGKTEMNAIEETRCGTQQIESDANEHHLAKPRSTLRRRQRAILRVVRGVA